MEEPLQKIDFGNKAILISRVSTPEQCLSQDLMPQLNDLKKWAKTLGYKYFYPIGTTESGFLKEDKKQGWNLVIDCLKKDPSCKVIICTEISRLSRQEVVLQYIKDYLLEHKIQLLIKDIGFALFDEFGKADAGKKLIFSLFASLASSEMATKKERFKRALKEYRKLGYSIGGKELFGYTRVYDGELGGNKKRGKYTINKEEAKEIQTIFKWYAYGIDGDIHKSSIFRITKECIARGMSKYLHSRRNVNKCLKEEAYTGFKRTKNKKKNPEYWNYKQLDKPKYIECEEYECAYPQIIERTLFNEVQELMEKRNSHNNLDNDKYVDKSNKHTTILSKLLVCPCCGKYLVGQYRVRNNNIRHTYRCTYSRGAVHICSYKVAPSMVMLDSAIWAYVKSTAKYIISKKENQSAQKNVDELKQSIKRLKKKKNQFDDDIDIASDVYSRKMKHSENKERKKEVLDEYEQKLKEIERQRKAYDKDITDKERLLFFLEEKNKKMNEFVDRDMAYIESNKAEMYKYIHTLIESIIPIYNDEQYTCLNIKTFKEKGNKEYYLDFKRPSKYFTDNEFLLINKKDRNRIKLKVLSGGIQWNSTLLRFEYNNSGGKGTIEDFFSTDFEIRSDVLIEELQYNRLDFYEEDKVNLIPSPSIKQL